MLYIRKMVYVPIYSNQEIVPCISTRKKFLSHNFLALRYQWKYIFYVSTVGFIESGSKYFHYDTEFSIDETFDSVAKEKRKYHIGERANHAQILSPSE